MKLSHVMMLTCILTTGCSTLPKWSPVPKDSKSLPSQANSPMSQLGEALPAMKQGDELELKIIAADQMVKHGYWSEAVELYLDAELISPKKAKLDAQLAPVLASAGRYPESLQRYRSLIMSDPKNAELINNFAYTLMESGNTVAAETEFRRALAIDPHFENANLNLGLLLAKSQRHDEALAILKPIIGEAAAHHNLGVVAIENGDEVAARQEFSRAASMPNAPAATHQFLAALECPVGQRGSR